MDPLSRATYSSDDPDLESVQQKRKEGLSTHKAAQQLAWKKSGPEMASLEAQPEEHEKYRSVARVQRRNPPTSWQNDAATGGGRYRDAW